MLKLSQTVLPIVAKPKTSRSEPAADRPPGFGAGLEVMGCATGGSTAAGPVTGESDPRSTQPAAGIAASAGISNFGLDLRRAGDRPVDGVRGDSLVADMVFSAC